MNQGWLKRKSKLATDHMRENQKRPIFSIQVFPNDFCLQHFTRFYIFKGFCLHYCKNIAVLILSLNLNGKTGMISPIQLKRRFNNRTNASGCFVTIVIIALFRQCKTACFFKHQIVILLSRHDVLHLVVNVPLHQNQDNVAPWPSVHSLADIYPA